MTERQQQYWVLLEQGLSFSEVARVLGVTRQRVFQATTGYEAQRAHDRNYRERKMRVLKYKCSLCGSRLHTKARHEK